MKTQDGLSKVIGDHTNRSDPKPPLHKSEPSLGVKRKRSVRKDIRKHKFDERRRCNQAIHFERSTKFVEFRLNLNQKGRAEGSCESDTPQ